MSGLRSRLGRAARSIGFRPIGPAPIRFLVVSPARSGSTLLRTYLDAHSRLVCHGELLGGRRILGLSMKGLPSWQGRRGHELAPELLPRRDRDSVGFLTELFDEAGHLSVGFKALYQQLYDVKFAEVLDWLIADTGLRVIHLERRNGLRRYVSHERHIRNQQDPSLRGQPLTIDPDVVQQDCRNIASLRARVDREFTAHPILPVVYEDFLADTAAERKRILGFLGVEDEELDFRTEPSPEGLRDTIENYDEIAAHPVMGHMLHQP